MFVFFLKKTKKRKCCFIVVRYFTAQKMHAHLRSLSALRYSNVLNDAVSNTEHDRSQFSQVKLTNVGTTYINQIFYELPSNKSILLLTLD